MVVNSAARPCSTLPTTSRLLLIILLCTCFVNEVALLGVGALSISTANGATLTSGNALGGHHGFAGGEGVGASRRLQNARFGYRALPAYAAPTVPVSVSKVRCGEIVVGVPERRNEDGTVEVDIGAEAPLVVARESLVFLSDEERSRFDKILESFGQPEFVPQKSVDELVGDTLIRARQMPVRKRMTHMRPRLIYPDDCKKDTTATQILSYDLGVGGEIRPRQLSTPRIAGRKQPHCWFRDDQMEFIVTDVDVYGNKLLGEVWSPSIVETKRQAYMAMAVESVKPTCPISPYMAVIKERDGDLLVLQLLDEHLEGFNAYSMALPKDNPGDRVMVYLAAADPDLQHVYFTRNGIGNEQLREENLKVLYDEMLHHYVKTGRWFRAQYEEDHGESIQLRVAGKPIPESNYAAHIFLSQMPYFSPEGLLNETFKRLNMPNEHFYYHDTMINVGKLNYGFNYDNCMFVRVHEYKVPQTLYSDGKVKVSRSVQSIELTTLNVCKPQGQLEKAFKKLTEQKVEEMKDLKMYTSYPSLVLGQDDGYLYLAINYLRKPDFTLADDYFVGIMKLVPKSKTAAPGSFVNARVAAISQNQVNMRYMQTRSEIGGHDSFKYTAFTHWLNEVNEGKQSFGFSRFEQQKRLNLIWMDGLCIPPPGSPQYDKYLALQPAITETAFVHAIDESLSPMGTENVLDQTINGRQRPLAPASLTTSLLRVARQYREETEKRRHVPIDMANFGSYTIEFDDHPDYAIAPPRYYLHNREIRMALIEELLNGRELWKFKRTLDMARLRTEGEIKAFFYDSRGRSFYSLLERMRDPLERRQVKPKEPLYFERSIKLLLSGIQDFYLEAIYDATDREKLIFASLVPRSGKIGDFVQMDELEQYDRYVRNDFVMDKEAREALQRVLRILSHPNNSLMSHMRHRHRTIPDDLFYAYRKTLHYETWVDYKMPEEELREEYFSSKGKPLLPAVSELVKEPDKFPMHLEKRGMTQIKGLYTQLMR
ncbi:hypothetical protein, conserved [Babesia bigemina]|uniref:Uncharacterized protein n=1 Tax=Babesia bigemina TaxID=5866 RepID=A0A061D9I1_BABBI|nr:hypothetical protein, conserved [Babesia bigemina]CDR96647.1 hypothetical protein, conserved [Babesia bigemina]|eukprot:XP_012768833.1 hypothetical protein, conserved [Babesia bigemina]